MTRIRVKFVNPSTPPAPTHLSHSLVHEGNVRIDNLGSRHGHELAPMPPVAATMEEDGEDAELAQGRAPSLSLALSHLLDEIRPPPKLHTRAF